MWQAELSSEKSVDFQRTTRRYVPEDRTLHNHRRENLKSYILGPMSCISLHSLYNPLMLFPKTLCSSPCC
jgi:hypothetical protein